MLETKRARSVEQTARLLLSNAFRYDTWECNAARREVQRLGGDPLTVQLTFNPIEKQDLPVTGLPVGAEYVEGFNLSVFDPSQRAFVGAAYRCDRRCVHEPLVFQAAPKQVVVVELLLRDTRPSAPLEGSRVTHWAHCPVESLGPPGVLWLKPGNARLLLLEEALWPAASAPSAASSGSLTYACKVNRDASLAKLMLQLVPPGVFVSESFTKATPRQGGRSFRLVVSSIELSGVTEESTAGLMNKDADWAVAAVAHNGYQQLGQGAEVPLAIEGGHGGDTSRRSSPSSSSSYSYDHSSSSSSSSQSSSYTLSSSTDTSNGRPPNDKKKPKTPKTTGEAGSGAVLRSELPLEIDGLPVHAATSLVLAIRRRTPESKGFKAVGFSVFPLCLLPMQNRNVRVESLPALRGPFSCEDARMLMVDAASPYGRIPITVTLTIEYHDVQVPTATPSAGADVNAISSPPEADAVTAIPPSPQPEAEATRSAMGSSALSSRSSGERKVLATTTAAEEDSRRLEATGAAVLSTADQAPQPQQAAAVPEGGSGGPTAPAPQPFPQVERPTADGNDGIFPLLCTIMEELRRVRETQDAILRQVTSLPGGAVDYQRQMSPAMLDHISQRLADGPFDVVDLAPRPLSISWLARRAITENVQPILHPTKGTVLDDNTPAPPGSLPASLFGIRFEGATLDGALVMPSDVCVMFSFGPLPYQQVGPMRTSSVERASGGVSESFKFFDSDNRGGFVWCEPVESTSSVAMAKYKECGGNSTLYLHLYDALTMIYIATATVPLAAFRRPYNAEAAVVPTDLVLQRDFSLTEHLVPPKVFPVMRQAGQLHVSLFCVGVLGAGEGGAPVKSAIVEEPPVSIASTGSGGCGRGSVIVARRLPHMDQLLASGNGEGGERAEAGPPPPDRQRGNLDGSVDSPRGSPVPHPIAPEAEQDASLHLHWQRASFVKQQLASHTAGSPLMPGVPAAHVRAAQEAAEMEFTLRYAERQRSEAKARAIAKALRARITVQHRVQVVAWRPEVVRTPFQNPHSVPMQFFVDIPAAEDQEVCRVAGGSTSFFLGPRERTEIALVVCMYPVKDGPKVGDTRVVKGRVCSERHEVMRWIHVKTTLAGPLVDRRYEIFGPAGGTVSKKLFVRLYSSSSFPITSNQNELLTRMRDLCSFAATSNRTGRTVVETNAVLDPITQTYVTAWEEATVSTRVPAELGRQRTEYVTFFYDADMTRVYETWELSIFACECLVTRDIAFGQTTALGLPSAGTEELYCDQPGVHVENTGASYVLRIRPKEVGSQRMLLHTLMADGSGLRKTILTVPVVYQTPSFTQVIELSLEDVAKGPLFRRLTFKHCGATEEVFQVHHNYRYQLKVSPLRFALAPNDTQFISLQLDSLVLPPGQLEGRWPMRLYINNAQDKTVVSYYLQVVLRAHPVAVSALDS